MILDGIDILAGGVYLVPINYIRCNNWNFNKMRETEYNRLKKEFINGKDNKRFAIQVRITPDPKVPFEVIDGEHRYKACKDSGLKTVYIYVQAYDDAHARMGTIKANRFRGEHDPIKEAGVIEELVKNHGMTMEDIKEAVGYDNKEMSELSAILSFNLDDYNTLQDEPITEISSEDDMPELLEVFFTSSQKKLMDTAINKAGFSDINRGLMAICKSVSKFYKIKTDEEIVSDINF